MSPTPDRLAAALADRYRIERELGAGGMATVYLAEDLKHKRRVAVKVLKPELAAVLGAERFAQDFHRDLAFVLEVLGEIDGSHATLAELALDAVAVGESGGET